jgi:SAM-dependent methyltransferase
MLLSNLEYVALRLIRRFLFPEALLLRFGHWFPYYRVNYNQLDSATIACHYLALLAQMERTIEQATILEIGAGSTNSTAYALAARTAVRRIFAHEPYVKLRSDLDSRFLAQSANSVRSAAELCEVVTRLTDTSEIPAQSVDLILSHSVLEHVSDPDALFTELKRLLKPGGAMLHIVDYRDHFFKYPYHFLQFSRWTWNHLLNPGDLPRWRLGDHLKMLRQAGFAPTVLESTQDDEAFGLIRSHLSQDFDPADPHLPVQTAAIFLVRDAHPAR